MDRQHRGAGGGYRSDHNGEFISRNIHFSIETSLLVKYHVY